MASNNYLLDTNICVFLLRGKFDIAKRIANVGIRNCAISEITVVELLYGAYCSQKPAANIQLVNEFCSQLVILPISDVLDTFAHQKSILRERGLLIDDFDLFIGCTAIAHDYTLVTDNTKHFERLPLKLENWIVRDI